jgi:hypothetical protein
MTIEEKREKARIKQARWLANNPEKRERNRLKNIEWRKNNPEKYKKAVAAWRARNPSYEETLKLKLRYGITPQDYEQMHQAQNGLCAICGNPETARHNKSNEVQKLAVDHCHKTGKVRGLLCQDCNRGIGKFKDSVILMEKAIKYLNLTTGSRYGI